MSVGAGFSRPALSAQSTFRALMEAFSRPGSIHSLGEAVAGPVPLTGALAAVALTVLDGDSPVWLDAGFDTAVVNWLRFHTGAPTVADTSACMFALISDPENAPSLSSFCPGTAEYPDCSATLVIRVRGLTGGPNLVLTGPGIDGTDVLSAWPMPPDLPAQIRDNSRLFPRGVDLLFVADDAVAALPRSVQVTEA